LWPVAAAPRASRSPRAREWRRGTYPLTVTATGGGLTRTAYASLTVTPTPDFSLSVSPAAVTVSRRQTAVYTVAAGAVGAFTGR
jgi:hypothetical protein